MTEQEINSALLQLRESTNNEIATIARILMTLIENAAKEASGLEHIASQFDTTFSEKEPAKD